jgi:hypothetical protein
VDINAKITVRILAMIREDPAKYRLSSNYHVAIMLKLIATFNLIGYIATRNVINRWTVGTLVPRNVKIAKYKAMSNANNYAADSKYVDIYANKSVIQVVPLVISNATQNASIQNVLNSVHSHAFPAEKNVKAAVCIQNAQGSAQSLVTVFPAMKLVPYLLIADTNALDFVERFAPCFA